MVRLAGTILTGLGLLTLVVAGCARDHRIGLDEFLDIQRRAQLARAQAPKPSPEAMERTVALIDRRLGPYRVGVDDVLSVTLTGGDPSLTPPPVDVRVDDQGIVELPLVPPVKVGGLTLKAAEDAIKSAYVPAVLKDAAVLVEVVTPQQTSVLVTGAVTLPGLVPLRNTDRNLLFAIVGAGGVTSAASGKVTLRRLRRPFEEVTLDLKDLDQLQASMSLEPLENGDVITVHAATPNTIFVGGLVNLPHPQLYDPGVPVTVMQALVAAGGVRQDLSPREGTLIRRMPDGEDVQVRLDLNRIARGQDPNIELAPGDVLWVPHTVGTRILEFINRNVFLRAGASVTYTATAADFMNSAAQQQATGGNLDRSFDPFGSLTRNAALQQLVSQPPP